ncbi:hypothetical protein L873DRAFT_1808429 [Choiromyces venosus 120613-1]|uniref:Uncharacterized protein n=1 Tax=Choiromyces venosus 120613-1 TaxID=1336337 RepID=A0A3N4JJH5_9PEZI|nr:hypothetical protein L873DRAFT_1808429 [Choiromyces venosus 120613-1]
MSSATSIPSTTNPHENASTNASASMGKKIEGVVSGIHGTGGQIRGQFSNVVDTAVHDVEGQALIE